MIQTSLRILRDVADHAAHRLDLLEAEVEQNRAIIKAYEAQMNTSQILDALEYLRKTHPALAMFKKDQIMKPPLEFRDIPNEPDGWMEDITK